MNVNTFAVFLVVLLVFPCVFAQSYYYISPTGRDSNSGAMGSPFKTIMKGVSMCNVTDCVLRISNGTYNENVVINVGMTSKQLVGYGGVVTLTPAYPGNAVVIGTNQTVTINGINIMGATNSAIYVSQAATLTVQSATIELNSGMQGAAINAPNGATVNVFSSILQNNTATTLGGAIYASNATVKVAFSKLTNNKAGVNGGAIYITNNVVFSSAQNLYSGNVVAASYDSRNIFCSDSSMNFTLNTVANNTGISCNQTDTCVSSGDLTSSLNAACTTKPSPPSPSGLGGGEIAAIVIGVGVGIAIIVVIIVYVIRKRNRAGFTEV